MKKLNLGCGRDKREGWINLDVMPELEPDIVHDLHDPLPFKTETIDHILAQDILEHFTKEKVSEIIEEFARVMKVGATVEIRIPNIDEIIEKFEYDKETRNEFLYGTTYETGVFGAHKVGFTPVFITQLLLDSGLVIEKFEQVTTNFHITAKKSQKKKLVDVVVILQSMGMGGAEVFWRDLLTQIAKKKLHITIYSNSDDFLALFKGKQFTLKKIPFILDFIGNWKGLIKGLFVLPYALVWYFLLVFQHRKTQLFFMSGYTEKIILTFYATLFSIPTVWIEFGPLNMVFKKFLKFPKLLYYLAKDLPKRIIVPTNHTKQQLIAHGSVRLSKLTVIPCGRNIVVSKYKDKVIQNNLVCVSRLQQGKGQDLLIRAFALLKRNHKKLHLKLVGEDGGDGKYLKELQDLVKDLKLKDVEFLGRVDDQLTHIATANICVFPSVWELEGFGLVMIEAMAFGKPVIAFKTGPAPLIIEDKRNGMLAQEKTPESLAEVIDQVLESKTLKTTLRKNSVQSFNECFSIEHVAQLYESVLISAVNRHEAEVLLRDIKK